MAVAIIALRKMSCNTSTHGAQEMLCSELYHLYHILLSHFIELTTLAITSAEEKMLSHGCVDNLFHLGGLKVSSGRVTIVHKVFPTGDPGIPPQYFYDIMCLLFGVI